MQSRKRLTLSKAFLRQRASFDPSYFGDERWLRAVHLMR
jgi:hypothetical protein